MTSDPIDIMASLRLEDGRRWGEVAADFQLADAVAILTPGPDDQRAHWLGRPKGGSKSTDLGGVAIAWLLTQAATLDEGYVIASDQEQAKRLLDRARGLITRTPGLADKLEVQTWAIVSRVNGARVVALAADAAGAEGTVSPLYLVDELPQWPDTANARAMWTAAFSSIPKGATLPGGMTFAVIGHAGIEGSWQHKVYSQVRASPRWRVNDVPGPLPWMDPVLLEDQRAMLTDAQHARRVLNQWSTGDEAIATVEELRRCVTLQGPQPPVPGVRYMLGVDLGIKGDRTVAAVAHAEHLSTCSPSAPDGEWVRMATMMRDRGSISASEYEERMAGAGHGGLGGVRIVLDRMEVWQGSRHHPVQLAEVQAWLYQASTTYNRAAIVADPWQAIGLAQSLRDARIDVTEFSFSQQSVGRLASTLHRLLRDGALALPDDEALLDELAHVRLVEKSPGVLRLDHQSGRHDDRAIALALVATHLLEVPVQQEASETMYRNDALRSTR